uniref:Uncharacterized protein n=1 Tax=Meloidogyne hapla TaxID=6305 RepID=A0A1I8BPR9_MELHA
MTEFIVGLRYKSFKIIGNEFENTVEMFEDLMIERYDPFIKNSSTVENTRKLFDGLIENKNVKTNYWTKHIRNLKDAGFFVAIGKPKTVELEDIDELIKNNYGGYDEELTPSRLIYENVSKDSKEQIKNKVPTFKMQRYEKMEMEKLIKKLKEVYEEINKQPYDILNNTMKKAGYINQEDAEFMLKKALNETENTLNEEGHCYTTCHRSFNLIFLGDKIEENMELPKEWLEQEENIFNSKDQLFNILYKNNDLQKLLVLIRFNAGKVLLAYTRMKKIFNAFYYNDDDKKETQILAETFEKEFKDKSDQKILEKIHERIADYWEKN